MAAATAEFLGPYDVTDYATWEAAIVAKGATAADIKPVKYGNNIIFIYKVNT